LLKTKANTRTPAGIPQIYNAAGLRDRKRVWYSSAVLKQSLYIRRRALPRVHNQAAACRL